MCLFTFRTISNVSSNLRIKFENKYLSHQIYSQRHNEEICFLIYLIIDIDEIHVFCVIFTNLND